MNQEKSTQLTEDLDVRKIGGMQFSRINSGTVWLSDNSLFPCSGATCPPLEDLSHLLSLMFLFISDMIDKIYMINNSF